MARGAVEWGAQTKGPCARDQRVEECRGIDVTKMYPAKAGVHPRDGQWTWETHLKAAEACQKAGMTFAHRPRHHSRFRRHVGALFAAYGAELVDAKGNVTVNSDAVRQVLEHAQSW